MNTLNSLIDGWLSPVLWLLGDWSLRWGLLIALVGAWFALRAPSHAETRMLVCRVLFVGGLLLPLVPHVWGPVTRIGTGRGDANMIPAPKVAKPQALAQSGQKPPEVTSPDVESSAAVTFPMAAPATVAREPLGMRRIVLLILAGLWLGGVLVQAARLAAGCCWLAWLRRAAQPFGGPALEQFETCQRELGVRANVRLGTHPAVYSPVFVGGWRPWVLVPHGWEELSEAARRAILLHELAHAARGDDLAKLAEEVTRVFFFFHPLVHYLLNRIDREREELCDKSVVRQGVHPRELAQVLFECGCQASAVRRWLALEAAILPFYRPRTLKHRVRKLLEYKAMSRCLNPPSRSQRVAVLCVSVCLLIALGSFTIRAADPQQRQPAITPRAKQRLVTVAFAAQKDSLEGTLVDSQGQPLPSATVTAVSHATLNINSEAGVRKLRAISSRNKIVNFSVNGIDETFSTTTDDQGHFVLDGSPDGEFVIGQMARLGVVTSRDHSFEVNALAERPMVVHVPTLAPAGLRVVEQVGVDEFAGVVVDERGTPLEGVRVDAWDWYPGNETTTDKEGIFRLKGFDRGERIQVRFSKPGYSGETFVEQPTAVSGWVLAMNSKTYFEGTVRGADGKPAAGAQLRANQGPKFGRAGHFSEIWTETKADESGKFRLYVQPDAYEIMVTAPANGVARLERRPIGFGHAQKLDVDLEGGVTFRAKIVDSETSEPVADVRLFNWKDKSINARSDAEGVVTIPEMLSGKFEFQVDSKVYRRWWSETAITPWARKSIDEPELQWQRNFDGLDFELSSDMEPVVIVVEKGVRIRGRITDPDGKPVGGATAAPALTGTGNSLTGDTRFSVTTKDDGTFEMLLPASNDARYNLVAHDGKYQQWRQWANGVLPTIQTTPGQEINDVELKLTRPAIVRGKVIDAQGNPVPYRDVQAQAADKQENRYYDPATRTKEDGTFELRFVRPGEQYIQVAPFWMTAEDGPSESFKKLTLTEGQTAADVELIGQPRN